MALQSEQQTLNGSVARVDKIPLPCQLVGDDDSQASGFSIPDLPEDIWHHIHSLMPMDVAASAACLSRAFLTSWRCYPKLDLNPDTLCCETDRTNLRCRVDNILRNHSGIGLKILDINLWHEKSCIPYIDSWLQLAVTPGIEEITLTLCEEYNFPCSVLSDGARNSVRSLHLTNCTFRPMPELGTLRSLTTLKLWSVRITGDELERLLSNSPSMEHLRLQDCKEIIVLKIPSMLQQFSYLEVSGCWNVQAVENKAPNLTRFLLIGKDEKLSLGEASQMMKAFSLSRNDAVCYGRAELPSMMPNLESLVLSSFSEVHTPPMLPTKFLNLKHLAIQICWGTYSSPSYDYFSLVSFLDACPSMETWYLNVYQDRSEYESVFGASLHFRQLPEHLKLKSVEIVGFKSAKILVELTCCIVKSATSLERLKLNTFDGFSRCSEENNSDCRDEMCRPIRKAVLKEASRALVAITRHIEDKVPASAKLTVLEPCPCPRCRSTHMDDRKRR
ncbi:unnamed protein product [Urochloa decumbens]|uniref:At1g61320/AtMIF1 LRR domain-containing protein n=1 Tax=Urochloa decumbens TaxID=240449 RepID=A0ABC9BXA1_9POAL